MGTQSRFIVLIGVFGLTACGYNVNPYGVSVKNVEVIKGLGIKPVSVADFTASEPGENSIGCRSAGPIETPDKISFESYIRNAFIDELKLSGVYDAGSQLNILGRLESIDLNSNIGAGKWVMKLAVSSKNSPGFIVESTYRFSTNWVADKACQQVAQAFEPAVQHLIETVVSDPRFKALAQ